MRNLFLGIVLGFTIAVAGYYVDQRMDRMQTELAQCYAKNGVVQ